VTLYPHIDSEDSSAEIVETQPKRFSWQYEKIKRCLDLVVAVSSLVLASPLILLLAALIKLDSRGPLFFGQMRVGRNGQVFKMYKFRSMCANAENMLDELTEKNKAKGHMFKIDDDPRVTRVGKWIRRLSLDEIPQLFNVITGEMSLIGPRPPLPHEVKEYEPWQFRRLEAAPGISGLWQVKRGSEISFDEMVNLDIEYIDNWSLWMDIAIIIKTIPAMMRGQGAY
jgi:exopolysaccharide biosynthesis polyprenyl glycosylphosphotransferase